MKNVYKILLFCLIASLKINGQENSKVVVFEVVRPWGNIKIDSVMKKVVFEQINNNGFSITYTSNFDSLEFQDKFVFQLGDTEKSYRLKSETDDAHTQDSVQLNLIDRKNVSLYDKEYTIFKFFYDILSGEDEETLFFFIKEFGLIMEKPISWPVYSKIVQYDDLKNSKTLEKLNEIILYDSDFFRRYQKQN